MDRLFWFHALGVASSVAVHLAGYAGLTTLPDRAKPSLGPTMVSFDVNPPAPAKAPPPISPAPEPLPPAPAALPAAITEPAPAAAKPPAEETAAQPETVDLTGVTLTGDGTGEGWASATGNGLSSDGRIRRPRPPRPPEATPQPPLRRVSLERTAPAAPSLPGLVRSADLSRRPAPPALDGVLKARYPADARRQGLSGSAVVTARIDPDGHVRSTSVRSESAPGFGEACRNTVLGSVWTPPLDRAGQAVATEVSYTCRFVVDR